MNRTPLKGEPEKLDIRPVRSNEIESVKRCINRSFSPNPDLPFEQDFFTNLKYIKQDRSEFFWAVFRNGIPVSGLILFPFSVMLEYTPLHLLVMTGVGTDPDYRHRGYASQLIQKVHRNIRLMGFDGIVIHSAADKLYLKHDYTTVFCEYHISIPWTILNQTTLNSTLEEWHNPSKHVQFFIDTQIMEPISEALYDVRRRSTQFVNRPFRQIRYPYYFHQRLQQHLDQGSVLLTVSRNRTIIAYMVASPQQHRLVIFEQYSLEADPNDFLLMWDRLITEFETSPLTLEMKTYPTDEVVLRLAKRFGAVLQENCDTHNMVHLYDPSTILPWMQTVFCHRLQMSDLHSIDSQFILRVDQKHFYFRLTRNIVSLFEYKTENRNCLLFTGLFELSLTMKQWIALTFGYLSIDKIFDNILSKSESLRYQEYRVLLTILFPSLGAVWDYFDPLQKKPRFD